MGEISWKMRELEPSFDGGPATERRIGVDTSTGDRIVETFKRPDYHGEHVSGIGSAYINDEGRWNALVDRQNAIRPEDELDLEPLPTLTGQDWGNDLEIAKAGAVGRTMFSGLGGLLGPNGSLTKGRRN